MENKELAVSALVPAYNEEKNIRQIILLLKKSRLINEIICINDGSTDQTLKIISKIPDIKIINLEKKQGKANALVEGIKRVKGKIVVFIDADLIGLKDTLLKKLINPLKKGEADAVIGYPTQSKLDKFFKPLTGERAYFKKDLLPFLPAMKDKRWGLELYLNYLFRNSKLKIIPLPIKNTMKHHKYSYDLAAKEFFIESFDILWEILKQKRPIDYLKGSYIYHFYRKRKVSKAKKNYITKMFKYYVRFFG